MGDISASSLIFIFAGLFLRQKKKGLSDRLSSCLSSQRRRSCEQIHFLNPVQVLVEPVSLGNRFASVLPWRVGEVATNLGVLAQTEQEIAIQNTTQLMNIFKTSIINILRKLASDLSAHTRLPLSRMLLARLVVELGNTEYWLIQDGISYRKKRKRDSFCFFGLKCVWPNHSFFHQRCSFLSSLFSEKLS